MSAILLLFDPGHIPLRDGEAQDPLVGRLGRTGRIQESGQLPRGSRRYQLGQPDDENGNDNNKNDKNSIGEQ